MESEIERIDRRIDELRGQSSPEHPFDWDDVEYLRLHGAKLRLGFATGFNPVWFEQMAEKLARTLETKDSLLAACEALLADADAEQRNQEATRRLYNAWQSIREAVNKASGRESW